MTLFEKAKHYAQNNNYNPYALGEAQRHFEIGLEKGFMAGYNAAKEENEWKTFQTVPEFGRLIVRRNYRDGDYDYCCFAYKDNDDVERNIRNGYKWKYID